MKHLFILSSIVFFTAFAKAGYFAEPYLGYQMGTTKTTVGGSSSEDKIKGTALGVRLGYEMLIPWFALDVKMFSGKDDSSPENDIKHTDIGLTVGATIPFVRPFVGYVPAAKITSEGGGTSTDLEGSAIKLGLGFTILPFLDINVEQTIYDIKEIDGASLSGVDIEYQTTMIGLGITF